MTLAEVIDLDHQIHRTRTKPLWRQGRIFLHFRWPKHLDTSLNSYCDSKQETTGAWPAFWVD